MAKNISVTIRIDEKLKRDAEVACAYLEHNLSSYIRSCLRSCVSAYHRDKAKDSAYAKSFMENETAQKAYAFLRAEVAKRPNGLEIPNEPLETQPPPQPPRPIAKPPVVQATKDLTKPKGDIKVDAEGKLDPATMSRKMRRAYERDLARGTFNVQPADQYESKSNLSNFDPEQRLRELLAKEKKGHLNRQERDQKNALMKLGLSVSPSNNCF